MNAMNIQENKKVNFLKTLNVDSYKLYHTYTRIIDVEETIRGQMLLSIKNTPKSIKINDIDFILFIAEGKILADYICIEKNGMFEMYEMIMKTYNEYENYMINN